VGLICDEAEINTAGSLGAWKEGASQHLWLDGSVRDGSVRDGSLKAVGFCFLSVHPVKIGTNPQNGRRTEAEASHKFDRAPIWLAQRRRRGKLTSFICRACPADKVMNK
jgi:hypothetical protein